LFFANAYLLKFEFHQVLYVDPRLYVQYLEEKIGMTPFDKLIYVLDRKIPLSILDIIEYINDEVRHRQYIPDDKYFISWTKYLQRYQTLNVGFS
jgi:hypothetical protein